MNISEKTLERASMEIHILTQDIHYERKNAKKQLDRIVADSAELGKMLQDPKFNQANMRDDLLMWIKQATGEYEASIKKADTLEKSMQTLKTVISLIPRD